MSKHRMRWVTALGLVGVGLFAAAPALAATPIAPTACPSNQIFIQPGGPINLTPTGGLIGTQQIFSGSLSISVTCFAGAGSASAVPISGEIVNIMADQNATPGDIHIALGSTVSAGSPVPVANCNPLASPPNCTSLGTLTVDTNGQGTVQLTAFSPTVSDLAGLAQPVGVHVEASTTSASGPVTIPGQFGGIFATPELDSLALFGAGAFGMAGYALTRLRASRRRTA